MSKKCSDNADTCPIRLDRASEARPRSEPFVGRARPLRCRASPQKISFGEIYRMQLSAEENVLHQGVSRCRCGSRHPFLALTHRLCADSRQTVPSACRHRSPVNRQGRRMRYMVSGLPRTMGTASAVVRIAFHARSPHVWSRNGPSPKRAK